MPESASQGVSGLGGVVLCLVRGGVPGRGGVGWCVWSGGGVGVPGPGGSASVPCGINPPPREQNDKQV